MRSAANIDGRSHTHTRAHTQKPYTNRKGNQRKGECKSRRLRSAAEVNKKMYGRTEKVALRVMPKW